MQNKLPLNTDELPQIIEAILFVSGEPVALPDMAQALGITQIELMHAVSALQTQYELKPRGICLKRYGDHIQLTTKPEYAPYVERLLQPVQKQTLSQAAMETLAVIAYRQPVTRGEIDQVRGVKCDYSVQSLLAKGLIKEVGRKDTLGRPMLYATTDRFLEHFGITDVLELPPLPEKHQSSEYDEALRDDAPLVP